MTRVVRLLVSGIRFGAALALAVALSSVGSVGSRAVNASKARSLLARLPLAFERNAGQVDRRVAFLARAGYSTLFLTSREAVLVLGAGARSEVVRMRLAGASPANLSGERRLPGRVNYLLGTEPHRWRRGIRTFARVEQRDVYPGVDVAYYGRPGRIERDFVVHEGADPSRIALTFRGADVKLDRAGDLLLALGNRVVREERPRVYQAVGGRRIPARFVLAANRVTFALGAYDRSRDLVIDPQLVYSTYLGGTQTDSVRAIAVDHAGAVWLAGSTSSPDFPVANPSQQSLRGTFDGFVTKLTPSGNELVYSTYIGGDASDGASALALDHSGNVYVSGSTSSTNFPTFNALQSGNAGGRDGYVLKMNGDGTAVYYSTYLGGSGDDTPSTVMAVDSYGNAYIEGRTRSFDYPLVNAVQPLFAGGTDDAFVTKIDPSGSALVYSTYLGGNGDDLGGAIAVDPSGDAYASGHTTSTNFPTGNAFQPAFGGFSDLFVTKLSPAGSVVYSTYLGGSSYEYSGGIAVDSAGRAYLSGSSFSPNFPTVNAVQGSLAGPDDGVVVRLTAAGTGLDYSTYLGGTSDDGAWYAVPDAAGNTYVVGSTSSTDFPLVDPSQPAYGGGPEDIFVSKLAPSGRPLVYSTYVGGSGDDNAIAIAVDSGGRAYGGGSTSSSDFPTHDPYQPAYAGGLADAVVFKLAASAPTGVRLVSFVARRAARDVVLRWRLGADSRYLGFDLYRGRARVNHRLIERPSFVDRAAPTGRVVYTLEAVGLDGTRTRLGTAGTR